jgi:beta-glucosidase
MKKQFIYILLLNNQLDIIGIQKIFILLFVLFSLSLSAQKKQYIYKDDWIDFNKNGWFPGEFYGQAVAETLFGDNNPGDKLAVTFPKSVGKIPFAFPFKPGSYTYSTHAISGALYPFGHGLSYTAFEYSNLDLNPVRQSLKGSINISVDIRNTGNRLGDEVVQLYIRDEISGVTIYDKVLRGFERIRLKPGETQRVTFLLTEQDLAIWDTNDQFTVEPGIFEVQIESSSQDIRLKGTFEMQ